MTTNALPSSGIVAVVGAGAMGAGIAQVAAVAGHRVRLLDNRPDVAARAAAGIRAQLAKMAENGRLTAADTAAAGKRLTPLHAKVALFGGSTATSALGAACGEDRHRISPLLHQKVFAARKFHD